MLINQLVEMLSAEQVTGQSSVAVQKDMAWTAAQHGASLLDSGFTVDQVVYNYGDLCQALTELAKEKSQLISVDEFRTFNRCLDNAISEAVTEFSRARDQVISDGAVETVSERFGQDLWALLVSAKLAYGAIKGGHAGMAGTTGAILERSLDGLRDLISRALSDVRLTSSMQAKREQTLLDVVLEEVGLAAPSEASNREVAFTMSIEAGLSVAANPRCCRRR